MNGVDELKEVQSCPETKVTHHNIPLVGPLSDLIALQDQSVKIVFLISCITTNIKHTTSYIIKVHYA